jgi:hypothetical protein
MANKSGDVPNNIQAEWNAITQEIMSGLDQQEAVVKLLALGFSADKARQWVEQKLADKKAVGDILLAFGQGLAWEQAVARLVRMGLKAEEAALTLNQYEKRSKFTWTKTLEVIGRIRKEGWTCEQVAARLQELGLEPSVARHTAVLGFDSIAHYGRFSAAFGLMLAVVFLIASLIFLPQVAVPQVLPLFAFCGLCVCLGAAFVFDGCRQWWRYRPNTTARRQAGMLAVQWARGRQAALDHGMEAGLTEEMARELLGIIVRGPLLFSRLFAMLALVIALAGVISGGYLLATGSPTFLDLVVPGGLMVLGLSAGWYSLYQGRRLTRP